MTLVNGILKAVAVKNNGFGLLLAEDENNWLNPDKNFKPRLEEFKEELLAMKGKSVEICFNEENRYISITCLKDGSTIVMPKEKTVDDVHPISPEVKKVADSIVPPVKKPFGKESPEEVKEYAKNQPEELKTTGKVHPIQQDEVDKMDVGYGEEPKKSFQGVKTDTSESMKHNIPKEYIIRLQGKEFITHGGLLAMGHKLGIKSIDTELLTDANAETIVCKATVVLKDDSSFTGLGDTNKTNVNKMIEPHKIRMAETRAINRALRFATNTGMCSSDELGGDSK